MYDCCLRWKWIILTPTPRQQNGRCDERRVRMGDGPRVEEQRGDCDHLAEHGVERGVRRELEAVSGV